MGRKQLTKIEKEEIVNLYKTGISASKIAKSYNTSVDTVSKWVKRAGIEVVNKQNIIKVSDYFAIKDYKNGMSLTQISKKYGIGRRNLSKRLQERGIEIVNRQNERGTNHNIFEIIDSEEKAYWLGFLYADGCISKNQNIIQIALKRADKTHLEKFREFIGNTNNKITYSKNTKSYRFCFNSKKIKQDLIKLGCIPAKSLTLKFPTEKQIPKDLIRHFIRGYFDGDGVLSFSKGKIKGTIYPSTGCIGTKDVLLGVMNSVGIIKNMRKCNKEGSDDCLIFGYAKEDSIIFLEYMYDNCKIYLERRYKRFKIFRDNKYMPFKSEMV